MDDVDRGGVLRPRQGVRLADAARVLRGGHHSRHRRAGDRRRGPGAEPNLEPVLRSQRHRR